jgi:hypothetical protein
MRRHLLLSLPVSAALCAAPLLGQTNPPLVLGFSDDQPVIYLQVKAGMSVHLEGITYDQFGYVAAYEETISSGDQTVRIHVATDPALKPTEPDTYQYSAEIDGKTVKSLTLAEWSKTDAKGLVGFAPRGLGGAVFQSPGGLIADFRTNLMYDQFGRQMVSRQEFKLDSVGYTVAYSGQELDQFGRLSSYSAEVMVAK